MGMLARAAEEGKDDGKGSSEPSFAKSVSEEVEADEEDIDSGGEGMRADTDSTRCH